MARYAEVGKQSVESVNAIVSHPVFQVSEVGANEGEVRIRHHVAFGVGILVEAIQVCALAESGEYLPGVSATAEGNIYIDAAWLDIQSVNALFQENGYVVCFCCLNHIVFSSFSL